MTFVAYPKPRPSLTRRDAEMLLQRVVAQAGSINSDPDRFPYAVKNLVVFGSYLTSREVLGDLDIAVQLNLVRPAANLFQERPNWRLIHWADRTYKALRVRKPRLVSVHDIGEVRELGVPFRQVFSAFE